MRKHRSRAVRDLARYVVVFSVLSAGHGMVARADLPPETPESAKAREEFLRGGDLANRAQWGEALVAFERSDSLRRHAVTTFNIGACQRAMGSYTRARETFARALTDNDAARGTELPEMLVTDAKGYVAEIDRLLTMVTVRLSPADARVAVDGRPLLVRPAAEDPKGVPVLVAGVRDPGPGEAPPAAIFRVVLDPGTRVFTLSRKGFSDAVATRTVAAGGRVDMDLALDRLPATFHVASSPTRGIVTVDGMDVGLTPVDLTRPAGSYRVVIREAGFVPYDTKVVASAGEEVSLSPTLPKEKTTLTQRWWFWTGAAAVVGGGVVLTYALTRPGAQPPPYDAGSANWLVHAQ